MEQELKKYYEDRFSTMATKGWKDFIEDVQNIFDAANKLETVNSPEDFWKRKGQVDILQWLLSLKDVSTQTYEELLEEEKNEKTV